MQRRIRRGTLNPLEPIEEIDELIPRTIPAAFKVDARVNPKLVLEIPADRWPVTVNGLANYFTCSEGPNIFVMKSSTNFDHASYDASASRNFLRRGS
jgi:hypothetical protein